MDEEHAVIPMPKQMTAVTSLSVALVALTMFYQPAHADDMAAERPPVSELHCVVMPSAVVDVASGVSGRVESIEVERGDTVQAGQAVAALESGVEQANLVLASARAELEASVHLREARLAFEQRKLRRTDELHSNRVVSLHEQDEAKTDVKLAKWQLRQAIDEKYLASLELVRAAEVLKRRTVRSPIDGVVVERFKWPGEYVEDEPVLRVARLDPLWVEVVAPVTLHGEVHDNMLAEVMTETKGGQAREARVIVIDPMADAASGTFRVRLELPNPDRSLLGGVKCKARFPQPARYAPAPVEGQPTQQQAETVAPEPVEEQPMEQRPEVIEPATIPATPTPQRAVSVPTASAPEMVQNAGMKRAARGYIVLTPRPSSRSQRHALTRALRDAGINDFMVMGRGPYAGRISLGTYAGPRMAERRRSQLSQLGFETDVVSRASRHSLVRHKDGTRRVGAVSHQKAENRHDERG